MSDAAELLRQRIAALEQKVAAGESRLQEIDAEAAQLRDESRDLAVRLEELNSLANAIETAPHGKKAGTPRKAKADGKTSESVRDSLRRRQNGASLSDIASDLPALKRTTISATLFNFKKGGKVIHDPDTKLYRLVDPRLDASASGKPKAADE